MISLADNQLFSQVPQNLNYQSVVRDLSGAPLINQALSMQFEIIEATPNGTVVYGETQQVNSNSIGLINTRIGQGSPTTGTFPAMKASCTPVRASGSRPAW